MVSAEGIDPSFLRLQPESSGRSLPRSPRGAGVARKVDLHKLSRLAYRTASLPARLTAITVSDTREAKSQFATAS